MQPQDDVRRISLPLLDSPVETTAVVGGGRGGGSFLKPIGDGDSDRPPPENGVTGSESRRINEYVLAAAVLASTNSILLGYDIGVMSGAILYIKQNLKITTPQVELLVGSLNICSLIGVLAAGKTADSIGRRYTILIAAATFLLGAIFMSFAPSFLFLLAGRAVSGIAVGISLMIAPVYVAELSPPLSRGLLTSLPEIFINAGILLGYISNYAFSGVSEALNWRIMLGISAIPAGFVALAISAMPESPRWLAIQGREAESKKILIKITESKEESELRFTEITRSVSNKWRNENVWKELLLNPSRSVRRILIAAVGVNFFMQASGNDAVVYYSPEVFKAAGIEDNKQLIGVTLIMGIAKLGFVFISAFFLDRFGRRPLLLLGSTGMACSLFGLGLGSKFLEYSEAKPIWAIGLCVVAVCAALSFFSIGLGPITWVYSSEIFPSRLRAQGSSLAVSVNRLVSGLVAMTFLSISRKISFGGMFFGLAGIMAAATVFFYYFLPETKGKSLEEIETLFEDQELR